MAEQKLIISATTPDGLDASKTISNINPDASNEQLAQLGQKLTALTDNTYGKTDRVIKYNCDTEGGGSKQTATITLTTASVSLADYKAAVRANNKVYTLSGISYNGDGTLYAVSNANTVLVGRVRDNSVCYITTPDQQDLSWLDSLTAPVTVTIRADETDNYKAAEATFTITA